jgi:hypothetical protein
VKSVLRSDFSHFITVSPAILRKPESGRVQNPMPIFIIGFLGFLPLSVDFVTGDLKSDEIYSDANRIQPNKSQSSFELGVRFYSERY